MQLDTLHLFAILFLVSRQKISLLFVKNVPYRFWYNICLCGTVWWESLVGGKFGEFALFEHLAKKFGELVNQPKGY